jgi:hypothetical protein
MPITRRRRANPPEQPENNNSHSAEQAEEALSAEQTAPPVGETLGEMPPAYPPVTPMTNGDRIERQERQDYPQTPQYPPSHQVEGGRRTARGELFRRAPVPPQAMQPPVAPPSPIPSYQGYPQAGGLQAPTHEIALPLGNLLHLAYNPGYTGADEARSELLRRMADESKAGGRARCWNCGSIAIAYDRWNTRSKAFGEIGLAYCEICGVWSVL